MIVIDAHEDLAWNSLTFGRDYLRPVAETRAAEVGSEAPEHNGQSLIGWPEWVQGRVAVVFATLFASPARHRLGDWDRLSYADAEEAHRLYLQQADFYHRWVEDHSDRLALVRTRQDLEAVLATWEGDPPSAPRVGLVLLMEGADGVRHPEELELWWERGVRLLGPAWSGTRYAGGTREPGPLTAEGRALLEAMAEWNLVLDLSHMSDEGALEAIDRYEGPLIASHSNTRALLPNARSPERHLSDLVIQRLAEREGVIGVVLANYFLKDGWRKGDPREAVTLDHVVAHIDHLCQKVGDARHVGIGSDFDGGFGLEHVPVGLDSVADLPRIGEALRARGYREEDVVAVLGGNWLRVLRDALPEE